MARETGDYITELIAERGEPTDWVAACQLVQEALLRLGTSRQRQYGHGNIAEFAEIGIVVRATDKLKRAWTMLKNDLAGNQESIEDSFGDLSNYGLYGVMLQRRSGDGRRWWDLPLKEEPAP